MNYFGFQSANSYSKLENITYLISNYNNKKYVEHCLNSLRQQTSQRWNALVCDDASTDDSLVKKTMTFIYKSLKEEGSFVFTNQSGHVNMEMVTQIFVDFNQQPLQMTVRSARQMNDWAREAGFQIVRTLSDKWGYYSVTLATKKS